VRAYRSSNAARRRLTPWCRGTGAGLTTSAPSRTSLAGVGDGNFTTPALDALKRARAKGVNVVRSSRVGSGIIRRNIEVNDDALGSVASMALNPTAIQTYFDTY
jgi:hypothetical protein